MRPSRTYASEPGTAPFNPALHEHRIQRTHRNLVVTIAGLCYAGAAAACAMGVWRWYFAFRNYGPAVVARWSTPFIILALVLAFAGFICTFYVWNIRGLSVRTSQTGLLLQRAGSEEFIAWERVSGIISSSTRYGLPWFAWGGRAKVILHLSDGRRLQLTHLLTDLDRLTETVKRYIYPRLLKDYQAALQEGHAVELGQLKISAEGLTRGNKQIAWSGVTQVSLSRGVLLLHYQQPQRKRVLRFSVQRVPNVDLCFKLIQHFTSTSQADSTDLAVNTRPN